MEAEAEARHLVQHPSRPLLPGQTMGVAARIGHRQRLRRQKAAAWAAETGIRHPHWAKVEPFLLIFYAKSVETEVPVEEPLEDLHEDPYEKMLKDLEGAVEGVQEEFPEEERHPQLQPVKCRRALSWKWQLSCQPGPALRS